jgi:large subunit ribosomal protein L9
MKVVLLEDIPGTGRAGEIKEVSKGYAKNFLLPRRVALIATAAVIKQVESGLERKKLEESVDREKLVELAQQIEGKEIHLKARMGGGERLFGSITAADVAEELSRAVGSPVDKKKIDIEKLFRQTGSYEVAVKLGSDIKPKITVVIEEEEKEAETEQRAEKVQKEEKEKRQEKKKETEPKVEKEQEKEEKKEKKKRKAKGKEEREVKEEKKE